MNLLSRYIGGVALFSATFFQAAFNPAYAQADGSCRSRAWINAFEPEKPVFPKDTDRCPANEALPLFTRQGTLACPNQESFMLAYNAMTRGWAYVPTAGVRTPCQKRNAEQAEAEWKNPQRKRQKPEECEQPGMPTPPAHYGCTIHPDGTSVTILAMTFSQAQTSIGWVSLVNLRN